MAVFVHLLSEAMTTLAECSLKSCLPIYVSLLLQCQIDAALGTSMPGSMLSQDPDAQHVSAQSPNVSADESQEDDYAIEQDDLESEDASSSAWLDFDSLV